MYSNLEICEAITHEFINRFRIFLLSSTETRSKFYLLFCIFRVYIALFMRVFNKSFDIFPWRKSSTEYMSQARKPTCTLRLRKVTNRLSARSLTHTAKPITWRSWRLARAPIRALKLEGTIFLSLRIMKLKQNQLLILCSVAIGCWLLSTIVSATNKNQHWCYRTSYYGEYEFNSQLEADYTDRRRFCFPCSIKATAEMTFSDSPGVAQITLGWSMLHRIAKTFCISLII